MVLAVSKTFDDIIAEHNTMHSEICATQQKTGWSVVITGLFNSNSLIGCLDSLKGGDIGLSLGHDRLIQV